MSKRAQNSILHFFGKKPRAANDSRVDSENVTPPSTSSTSLAQRECATPVEKASFSEVCISSTSTTTPTSDNSEKSSSCVSSTRAESVTTPNACRSFIEAHPYDIGLFAGKDIASDKKLEILNNIWEPNPGFKFPAKGKRNLRFQCKWLYRWKWLAYSDFQSGAFCKFCALFAPTDGAGSGKQPLGQLCKVKFDTWKDAVERFAEHENCRYHKNSVEIAGTLGDIALRKKTPVDEQLDTAAAKRRQENRKNIAPIIETVLFCGEQGLALRGHRDSGRIEVVEKPEENDGNFRALLRFRSKCDIRLKNMLESSGGNAQYTSPRIQNEVIEACNDLILRRLVQEVNEATCFSVLADESTDIAGIEQLSLCVRYIDRETSTVRENFLQFIPVQDVTGKGIATTILDKLQSLNIEIRKLRGQGYDGAGAMRGKNNGVQAHVREVIPSALYVHCTAHSLNLAVSTACCVTAIRNCMGTVGKLYDFLNTPKRQNVLTTAIANMETTASGGEKLKRPCETRWLERHDSVAALVELLDPVVETLQQITEWKDKDSSTLANSLLCTVTNCQFVISLFCIHKVFSLTVHLCRFLQRPTIDLVEAVNLAEDISGEIKSLREHADEEFGKIFVSASEALEKLGSSIKVPRVAGRQIHRTNVPAVTPEAYFRSSIFIPFLDAFLSELDVRFLEHREILKGFQCILPTDTVLQPSQLKAFAALTQFYASDLDGCQENLNAELKLWLKRISRNDEVNPPKTATEALAICNPNILPNIFRLLEILAVLPVSTCTNERSFSTLRRLKTYLRNSTGSTRMNGLALLHIYRNRTPTVEDVLNELAKKPRRLDIAL